MRVLVIDDDPDDRRLASRALSQELESPDIVEIGDDATLELALSDALAPALAVTDYALNWSDGLAVFQRIRAAYPNCPVVVFTSVGDETLAVELIKAGVDDYVVKHGRRRLGEAARGASFDSVWSMARPPLHEARLGPSEQPSSAHACKG